jgi:DNA-binding transcriptional regulator YiaG
MKTRKRTRNDEFGRRRELVPAEEVRRVRAALKMTQTEFATALCITPRTVIRGEARGLEVPMRQDTRRPDVYVNWCRLQRKTTGN